MPSVPCCVVSAEMGCVDFSGAADAQEEGALGPDCEFGDTHSLRVERHGRAPRWMLGGGESILKGMGAKVELHEMSGDAPRST